MHLPYLDHGGEDVVPGLLLHHHRIREHTTIPANVLESFCKLAVFIAQPMACIRGYIELAVRISSLTVATRLIMRPGSKYCPIVLCNVKVDSPGTQRFGDFRKRGCKDTAVFPIVIFRQDPVFGSIIPQCIK